MQHDEREQQISQEQVVAQPDQSDEQNTVDETTPCEQQLAAERQTSKEYLDLLQRTQADFINYRRRISQGQLEIRNTAQSELLSHLLPVFDDLGRALDTAPQELTEQPWVQGLFLVEHRLLTLLDQLGVKRIGEPGERFDPYLQEAIATMVSADQPEGTILQVVQPGYSMNGRVIRPAQVIVTSKPSATQDTPEPQVDSDF